MHVSDKLVDFTAQSEGFSATPYWDVDGYSIGYGHHSPEVVQGMQWTIAQAKLQLAVDLEASETDINSAVKVALTQGQFDCLCDFRFNVGSGNFSSSTLLKILNNGDYNGARDQLYRVDDEGKPHGWIKAGDTVVPGLVNRRIGEQKFWDGKA